jgi:hypothetical protein
LAKLKVALAVLEDAPSAADASRSGMGIQETAGSRGDGFFFSLLAEFGIGRLPPSMAGLPFSTLEVTVLLYGSKGEEGLDTIDQIPTILIMPERFTHILSAGRFCCVSIHSFHWVGCSIQKFLLSWTIGAMDSQR